MKARCISFLLATVMVVSTTVFAAETDNLSQRNHVYQSNFSDLTQDNVFYDNVVALYEYGLSVGKADGTFDLNASLTLGEAMVFTARIRSLILTGDAEGDIAPFVTAGQSPYDAYVLYLQGVGALESDFATTLYAPATRAQLAHLLANALPEGAISPINADAVNQGYALGNYITDVDEYTPYFWDILTLYRWGISAGYDKTGTFSPTTSVTRGAAAAMLTRMVDATLRLSLDWQVEEPMPVSTLTYGDLVSPGAYLLSPESWGEMDESVRYMLSRNENVLELKYDSLTLTQAREWMDLALSVTKSYCEQGYNTVVCDYETDGRMALTFGVNTAGDALAYRTQALEAALGVQTMLWDTGALTAEMTQMEIAKVYYQWICQNIAYDTTADDKSVSHLSYSALTRGLAVCDGYTGAYNLLLKLENIPCAALSNHSHIWTVASLDDTVYHIDTTWGDQGTAPNWTYFAMTNEESRQLHPW